MPCRRDYSFFGPRRKLPPHFRQIRRRRSLEGAEWRWIQRGTDFWWTSFWRLLPRGTQENIGRSWWSFSSPHFAPGVVHMLGERFQDPRSGLWFHQDRPGSRRKDNKPDWSWTAPRRHKWSLFRGRIQQSKCQAIINHSDNQTSLRFKDEFVTFFSFFTIWQFLS